MIKNVASKALPVIAAAAMLIPASRKVFNSSWREELGASYSIGDTDFGTTFFLLVGLLEFALAAVLLWPKTRVPAGLAMAGFFVGALISNLVFRIDADLLPDDRASLAGLIPLDITHLLLGLAVAFLWRSHGQPSDLLVSPR